jgi:hypothetical protein
VKIKLLSALVIALSGCGMDLTGEKFHEEKDARYETTLKLNDSERVGDVLKELLSNVTQSKSFQWAYVDSHTGIPIDTYEKASVLCSEIAFDLPTRGQIQGEGMTVDGIKNIVGDLELPLERLVFLKDEPGTGLQHLICVREIPSL